MSSTQGEQYPQFAKTFGDLLQGLGVSSYDNSYDAYCTLINEANLVGPTETQGLKRLRAKVCEGVGLGIRSADDLTLPQFLRQLRRLDTDAKERFVELTQELIVRLESSTSSLDEILTQYQGELTATAKQIGYDVPPCEIVRDWGKQDSLTLSDPDGNHASRHLLAVYRDNARVMQDQAGVRENAIATLRRWIRHIEALKPETGQRKAGSKKRTRTVPKGKILLGQALQYDWLTYQAQGNPNDENDDYRDWWIDNGTCADFVEWEEAKHLRAWFVRTHCVRHKDDVIKPSEELTLSEADKKEIVTWVKNWRAKNEGKR